MWPKPPCARSPPLELRHARSAPRQDEGLALLSLAVGLFVPERGHDPWDRVTIEVKP
jgi:hypothetical protein